MDAGSKAQERRSRDLGEGVRSVASSRTRVVGNCEILAQLERELVEAQLSVAFWQAQISCDGGERYPSIVKQSLGRALETIEKLENAATAIRITEAIRDALWA